MRLVFIICLLALTGFAQSIQRQFWTTNTNPREVIAQGTNVFITFSTPSPDVRQYLIDVPTSFGQTNNTVLSAGTNVVIVTNVSGAVTVYTVSAVPGVQTNVTLLAAGTNVFVHSATNNGVITYTIDVPTNAFPVQQTNWPWQSITNISTVQIPYAAITNPPSDIERTNWAITDITNSLNLTNWALLSTNAFTNVIVAAGSNAYITPTLSGQVRTYTVDVPIPTTVTSSVFVTTSPLTNQVQATNVLGASYYPFNLNINATGTNIYISPTNGNLQYYVFTNTAYFTLLSWNTNYTESIRLELLGSNTLTWATANLSNSANLGPSNAHSVILLDREAFTNLWWGYRLR